MKKVFFVFLSVILLLSSMGIVSPKTTLANTSLEGTYYTFWKSVSNEEWKSRSGWYYSQENKHSINLIVI